MRALRLVAAATLAPLAASLLFVGPSVAADPPAHPPIWDNGTAGERYVALGDSFASGPGIAPMRVGPCSRSEKNYATLLAQDLGVAAFTDASCGGAKTKDLWSPQTFSAGVPSNEPQLEALDEDTTLVTFGTLGGNDIGLVGLAQACAFNNCVPPQGTDPYAERFATVRTELARGLADAAVRAPNARLVVVGYSTYLAPGECTPLVPMLTSAESAYLQSQIDRLSEILSDVADQAGALFVDQRLIPGAGEHTVCAAANKQWIRALATYDDGVTFHPSACGMDATAQYLRMRLAEDRGEAVPAFDDSCVSAGPVTRTRSPTTPRRAARSCVARPPPRRPRLGAYGSVAPRWCGSPRPEARTPSPCCGSGRTASGWPETRGPRSGWIVAPGGSRRDLAGWRPCCGCATTS